MKTFTGTDRYELMTQLGSGTFGEVYAAYDHERRAMVALKRPHDTSPDSLYYFKREFRSLADTLHPNLVEFYELVVEDRQWFFTMELVEGMSFTRFLRQDPAGVDDHLLRDLLRQLTEGLLALHRAGKLHRDIKPSNVLVTPERRVVILDFGLAVDLPPVEGVDTLTTRRVGTPTYMAPEQLDGYQGTRASDWYSVGVMLYEVLAGRPPFSLGSVQEMSRAKLTQDPVPPSEWLEDVPEDLEEICMGLLRCQPSARLGGEAVLKRLDILPAQPLVPDSGHGAAPFLGREVELAALTELFIQSSRARATLVQLHGGSGTGKTQLLRHVMDRVRRLEPGAVILHGRCYTQESVPFKALDPLVDDLSRYLMRLSPARAAALAPRNVQALVTLFPVLDRVECFRPFLRPDSEPEDLQTLLRRASLALRELLGRIGERYPLLVVIDDLQWGDGDSARILREILSPPDPPSLMVMACYRTEDAAVSPALQELLAMPTGAQSVDMPLPVLAPPDAEALALALIGPDVSNAHRLAEHIARHSEGNPFYIGELAHQARLRCLSPVDTAEVDLFTCILRRLTTLPEAMRRIVEMVAIAGHPLEWPVVQRALGQDASMPPAGLFRAGRLLRMRSTPVRVLEMYHDYVRRAVVSSLDEGQQKECHLRLARAMEAEGTVLPEAVAQHYLEGGATEKAIEWITMAADRAASVLAFKKAAELYRRSIALRPSDDPLIPALLLHLAQVLSHAGLSREAAETYMSLAERIQGGERAVLQRKAADAYFRCGQFDQGLAIIRPLLARQGIRMPSTRLGRLLSNGWHALRLRLRGHRFEPRHEHDIPAQELEKLDTCWTVIHGLGTGALMSSMDLQYRHLRLALDVGEPSRVIRALAHQTYLESIYDCDNRKTRTTYYDALSIALAERYGDPRQIAQAHMCSGMAAFLQGRFPKAEESLSHAKTILSNQCIGVASELCNVNRMILHTQMLLGYKLDLDSVFLDLVNEARERGDLLAEVDIETSWVLGIFFMRKNNIDKARAYLARASEICSGSGNFQYQNWYLIYTGGIVEQYAGNVSEHWQQLERHHKLLCKARLLDVEYIYLSWCEHVARISAAYAQEIGSDASRQSKCLEMISNAAKGLEPLKAAYCLGTYAKIRAMECNLLGDKTQLLDWLSAAEKHYESASMVVHACCARWCRGAVMGESGTHLKTDAESWMSENGIRCPERYAACHIPVVGPRK